MTEFGNAMDNALSAGTAGLSQRLRNDMNVLWSGVQGHVAEIDRLLAEVERGTDSTLQKRLDDAGLDGEPLQIKMALFRKALDRFNDTGAQSANDIWQRLLDAIPHGVRDRLARRFHWMRGKLRGGAKKRLFRSVLRWANPILGSLAAAIPPVAYVKEVKELVEAGVEEELEEPDAPPGRATY
jgi:hypothetical protein